MVILHIASLDYNPYSGVYVVVPKYIEKQQEQETVAFINTTNLKFDNIRNQLNCPKEFSLDKLPKPFDKPDIVVLHEVYKKEYIKITKQIKKAGIPYVIVPHGCLTKESQKKKALKKRVANFIFFNRIINNAVALQCLSERESSSTLFEPEKFIVPNGVEFPLKVKNRFHNNSLDYIFIGRIDLYHKGLDILVEAVSLKKDFLRKHSVHIYIYGPDYKGSSDKLRNLISERGVEDIFVVNKEVDGITKEEKLLDADIFIQTSRYEGMPVGILEAMSYGVPCLLTEGTTLGKLTEKYNAGWSAETDAVAVSNALEKSVCEREKLLSKSEGALELVKNNFGWNEVTEKTIRAYKRIITVHSR